MSGGVRSSKRLVPSGADEDRRVVGLDADDALAGDLEHVVVGLPSSTTGLPRVAGVARAHQPEVLRQPAPPSGWPEPMQVAGPGVADHEVARDAARPVRTRAARRRRARRPWRPASSRNSPRPVPSITVPSFGSTAIEPMNAFAPLVAGAGVCAGASEAGSGVGGGVWAASVASSSPRQPGRRRAVRRGRRRGRTSGGRGGERNCGCVGRLGAGRGARIGGFVDLGRIEHQVTDGRFAPHREAVTDRPIHSPPYPAAVDVRSGPIQLSRHQRHVRATPSRTTSSVHGTPMRSSVISRCRSSTPRTASAVDADDQVLGAQPGGRGRGAVDDLDDLDRAVAAERRGHARRERAGAAGDADPGAPHAAVAHQRRDDPAGGGVDRHREPEPDARHRGVDPDHAAAAVDERAARVAGVQRRVGLDDVVDDPRRARPTARAATGRAPTRRPRSPSPRSRADCRSRRRAGRRAAGGVAQLGGRRDRSVGAQHREVGQRVGADTVAAASLPSMNDARTRRAAADHHVRAGEHEAVRRDHHARAAAGPAAAARSAGWPPTGRAARRRS